jgi:hypothetical protein
MKKLEKLSKEDLISELMMNTIKGGCCGGGMTSVPTFFVDPHGNGWTDIRSDYGGGGNGEPLPTGG